LCRTTCRQSPILDDAEVTMNFAVFLALRTSKKHSSAQ